MSKAILVLNKIPSTCTQCELCLEDKYADYICGATLEYVNIYKKEKLQNCPLKPLPKSINEKEALDITKTNDHTYLNGVVDGFRVCLDEILGEKE